MMQPSFYFFRAVTLLDLCAVDSADYQTKNLKFMIINKDANWHLKCQAKLGPEIRPPEIRSGT